MKSRLLRRAGPYLEILRALRDNRRRPGYAWRILNHGVCDGCALGTRGMRDWTMEGIHLCWIRLNLLHLNTMAPFPPEAAADAARLARSSEAELRRLGRIPTPLVRRRGDPGFRRLSWDEAFSLMEDRLGSVNPERLGFYLVSRGTANETYYAAQKAARALGTNHVDNSARICHSPSTTGLKETLGYAATTCSYRDLLASDLVVFIGSNAAGNQSVMMKYLDIAKRRGTRVAVVNPHREPGMRRYWVPSTLRSALFGTPIEDAHFTVRVGGDVAFLNGVLKILINEGRIDEPFIASATEGWDDLRQELERQDLDDLAKRSGASRESMAAFARLYGSAKSAVLVWSMGITMHRHGVDNVKALVNLALARGMVGKPGTGLMPIRGHSGVQGGAEMGCVPDRFPGGAAVDTTGARALGELWGFDVPARPGARIADQVLMGERGELDALYCVGSNLFGVLPEATRVRSALEKIPFRIHHDIVLNPQMLVEPADTVLVLPATTRYEMAGGNTETTTERRVIFNPEIPGPRVPEARDEWRVLTELAARLRPERADALRFPDTAALRAEIARVIPLYDGIQHLAEEGDQFQWGGERLGTDGRFPLPGGRARFTPLRPPKNAVPEGRFRLSTRRGKQFNSMVFGSVDSLLGAGRDAVFLARSDLDRLGLTPGDAAVVRSAAGTFRGRAEPADLMPGTVMLYWPEANVLIPGEAMETRSGMPAYRDAVVDVLPGDGNEA